MRKENCIANQCCFRCTLYSTMCGCNILCGSTDQCCVGSVFTLGCTDQSYFEMCPLSSYISGVGHKLQLHVGVVCFVKCLHVTLCANA